MNRYFSAFLLATLAWPLEVAADSIEEAAEQNRARLPAYLLEVPSTVEDILIADAKAATLIRYSSTDNGLVESDRRYMSIGRRGVGKQQVWDLKTPLGIYFITQELDASRLADKYGVAAFPLDYPNAWDLYNDRTGSGIWLHGVDANAPDRPPLDTEGCLSLPNEELISLSRSLVPQITPVIIVREMRWSTPANIEALRLEFRIALELWRESQEREDLTDYLALYDDSFRSRGMDKDEWSVYRRGALGAHPLDAIKLVDVMLLADPEERGLFLSRFQQTLITAQETTTNRKRLYWRRSGNNWRIVSEDSS